MFGKKKKNKENKPVLTKEQKKQAKLDKKAAKAAKAAKRKHPIKRLVQEFKIMYKPKPKVLVKNTLYTLLVAAVSAGIITAIDTGFSVLISFLL